MTSHASRRSSCQYFHEMVDPDKGTIFLLFNVQLPWNR